MKPLFAILVIASCLFNLHSSAQIRKIPSTVTEALKVQYPKADSIEWSDKITGYSATFTEGDKKLVAYYKNDASWERTEEEISFDDLPGDVKDAKEKSKYKKPRSQRIIK